MATYLTGGCGYVLVKVIEVIPEEEPKVESTIEVHEEEKPKAKKTRKSKKK